MAVGKLRFPSISHSASLGNDAPRFGFTARLRWAIKNGESGCAIAEPSIKVGLKCFLPTAHHAALQPLRPVEDQAERCGQLRRAAGVICALQTGPNWRAPGNPRCA